MINLFLILCCYCSSQKDTANEEMNTSNEEIQDFASAESCAGCHPMQYTEWKGSAMHYSASPTFAAFELLMNKLSDGAFAHGSGSANEDFCSSCHIPVAVREGQLPVQDPANLHSTLEDIDDVAYEGVSCTVCHSVTGLDESNSLYPDGTGTGALLITEPEGPRQGPNGSESAPHSTEKSELLSEAEFCGTCHDVRPIGDDVVTGEEFLRVENSFTEWKNSPWSGTENPYGEPVRCQDCHMSLYPQQSPLIRPVTAISTWMNIGEKEHSLHAFTAVSIPLVDDANYPNVDTPEVDSFGFPMGQHQRRQQMLQAAVHMDLNGSDEKLSTEDSHIRIQVNLINDGAGHNVPTGFSQEREVWIELTVRDAAGDIYSSGYLVDKAHSTSGEIEPDGRLNDEDLNHRIVLVNYETVEAEFSDGPDVNQRPSGVNLGLVSLTNDFVYVDDNGEHHPVLTPFHANHMNNDNALAPFEERAYFYDVPFPERDISGDIQVEARLLYRSFPPKFLRILAHHSPDLVDEQMIDRNEIVVMQEQSLRIRNIIP